MEVNILLCQAGTANVIVYFFLNFTAALTLEGHTVLDGPFFDTIEVSCSSSVRETVLQRAKEKRVNLRHFEDGSVSACFFCICMHTEALICITGSYSPSLCTTECGNTGQGVNNQLCLNTQVHVHVHVG